MHAHHRGELHRRVPVEVVGPVREIDVQVRAEDLVGEQPDRRAEALDLERAPGLVDDARPHPVRRRDHERQEPRDHGDQEHAEGLERPPPALVAPRVDQRDREDHDRERLRGEAEPQERKAGPGAAEPDRGDRRDRQQRRPQVVPREDHRSHQYGHQRPERDARDQPAQLRALVDEHGTPRGRRRPFRTGASPAGRCGCRRRTTCRRTARGAGTPGAPGAGRPRRSPDRGPARASSSPRSARRSGCRASGRR